MWAALVLLILSFYWWMSQKFTRTLLHPALWLWTACYAGYLFIFWLPTSSTFRILLPLFPLSLLVAAYLPKSRMYRLLLVLMGLLGSAPVDAPTLGRPGRDWPRLAAALKVG